MLSYERPDGSPNGRALTTNRFLGRGCSGALSPIRRNRFTTSLNGLPDLRACQFGADVVIQGKSGSHVTKLALRHHDVKRLEWFGVFSSQWLLFQRIIYSALPSLLPKAMPCAMLDGMTLKMDKAGRVILPKPVRDRLGLHEGSDLESDF
jgi:hypothetical protein